MASRKKHLKAVKKFLGWKGNSYVHILFDGGDLPKKLRIIYHKTTHNSDYIDKIYVPLILLKKIILKSGFHLLHDLGFIKTKKK